MATRIERTLYITSIKMRLSILNLSCTSDFVSKKCKIITWGIIVSSRLVIAKMQLLEVKTVIKSQGYFGEINGIQF